jgi:GTP cyclohydrolase I
MDRKRAESAMAEFLSALGTHDGAVEETASRVTAAYFDELLWGYGIDLERLVVAGSEQVEGEADPVVIEGLTTATVCPHHLLAARGRAIVAYVPGRRVLGLGTVARLVDACSRRFVLQEQIARDVTHALTEYAGAEGAFCRLTFDHACLQTRGARQPGAQVTTWSAVGSLQDPGLLETVIGRKLTEGET